MCGSARVCEMSKRRLSESNVFSDSSSSEYEYQNSWDSIEDNEQQINEDLAGGNVYIPWSIIDAWDSGDGPEDLIQLTERDANNAHIALLRFYDVKYGGIHHHVDKCWESFVNL